MIAALASKPDGHTITITGDTTCTHPFHTDGIGGTEPAQLGGGWAISHCPLEGCDSVVELHRIMNEQ